MKILIIRLSSLGDIFHALPCVPILKESFENSEIHWLVRSDFSGTLDCNPQINKIWSFDRDLGLFGFFKLCFRLRKEKYTHIYDAHNNIRSHIASFVLRWPRLGPPPVFLRRSKQRIKRWLLFSLKIKLLPNPFRSAESFVTPLKAWGITATPLQPPPLNFKTSETVRTHEAYVSCAIGIAPSAAWEMKRWPIENWKKLIQVLKDEKFFVLGGPNDDFCAEIAKIAPDRTLNLSGKLSWNETTELIYKSKMVVSGDTGVMHISDFFHKPTLALIGPTAFGYPTSPNSKFLESPLDCKPCSKDGRGKCTNKVYKKCLVDLTPELVAEEVKKLISGNAATTKKSPSVEDQGI